MALRTICFHTFYVQSHFCFVVVVDFFVRTTRIYILRGTVRDLVVCDGHTLTAPTTKTTKARYYYSTVLYEEGLFVQVPLLITELTVLDYTRNSIARVYWG